MKILTDIRLLLTAFWLGAAVFFVGVAQASFTVLPSHEIAGTLVGRTLLFLNFGGIGIGVLLLLLTFVTSRNTNVVLLWSERLLTLLIAAACATNQFVIGFWLDSLKTQMGRPIDEVAADDPLRMQFNAGHQYSVWLLMGAMGAALLVFFIVAHRRYGAAATKGGAEVYDFSKEFKS